MRHIIAGIAALWLAGAAHAAQPNATPEYVVVRMEIDVARPAKNVWARVGKFCDIRNWLTTFCELQGDGGIGSVRKLDPDGASTEILIAKTDLAYGYAKPAKAGERYNLYHGFLEAKPTGARTTKLVYTVMYDASLLPDQAARDADMMRRRTVFEGALARMKTIAEAR